MTQVDSIQHDCREIERNFKGEDLQRKVAELVADKYLHYFNPEKEERKNESNRYWLKYWADLLFNDSIRHTQLIVHLKKLGVTRHPQNAQPGVNKELEMFGGSVVNVEEWED